MFKITNLASTCRRFRRRQVTILSWKSLLSVEWKSRSLLSWSDTSYLFYLQAARSRCPTVLWVIKCLFTVTISTSTATLKLAEKAFEPTCAAKVKKPGLDKFWKLMLLKTSSTVNLSFKFKTNEWSQARNCFWPSCLCCTVISTIAAHFARMLQM